MNIVRGEKPLYFISANPYDWKRASLLKLKEVASQVMSELLLGQEDVLEMPWSYRVRYLEPFVLQSQVKRWEQKTGVKPEESHFTLIVPIHNEENSLASFLSTLMLCDLPSTLHMQVILVTNACKDSSFEIVRAFLSNLGEIKQKEIIDDRKDQNMDRICAFVEIGNLTVIHINTSTAGKANALRIGNTLAHDKGHLISMSIDANNFVEPDAIRIMFSYAHNAFRKEYEPGDTVLFCGDGKERKKVSRSGFLLAQFTARGPHLMDADATDGIVNGSMMSWNTRWLYDLEGPPQVALEDYAMGVLARVDNYKIKLIREAIIWTYSANDLRGMLNTRARHVRGKRQICDYVNNDLKVVNLIQSEAYYMRKFKYRLKYLFQRICSNPLHSARYLAIFLFWECIIMKGMQEYKHNPKNQSWEKVASTY